MLPGFTASYSLFRTRHVYRGHASPSWTASETGDFSSSDWHGAGVSNLDHIAGGAVLPARTFGPPPPPSCKGPATCGCSDDCIVTCKCPRSGGGTLTGAESCCALGGSCENGRCVCPPSLELCGSCTNVQTDPNNCGACFNACTGGKTCQRGQCLCPSGQATCNGACCQPGQICCMVQGSPGCVTPGPSYQPGNFSWCGTSSYQFAPFQGEEVTCGDCPAGSACHSVDQGEQLMTVDWYCQPSIAP
jgi:hypothetical protein